MRSAKRIHCLAQSHLRLLRGAVLAAVLLGIGAGCESEGSPDSSVIPIWPGVVGRSADLHPAWSPDGRTVAFIADKIDTVAPWGRSFTVKTVDVAGGEITTVLELPGLWPATLAWGPDGRWLVFSTTVGIFKMLATGDSLTRLTAGQYHVSPSWSRVSDRIFFGINGGGEAGIHSMSPDGTDLRQWTYSDSIRLVYPFLFPDSDTVTAFAPAGDSGLCLVLYFPGDTAITSVLKCGFQWLHLPRVSPDHRLIAFYMPSRPWVNDVFLFDRVDRSVRQLTSLIEKPGIDQLEVGFNFAPEGARLVYTDLGATRGLQIIEIETGRITQLTPGWDI